MDRPPAGGLPGNGGAVPQHLHRPSALPVARPTPPGVRPPDRGEPAAGPVRPPRGRLPGRRPARDRSLVVLPDSPAPARLRRRDARGVGRPVLARADGDVPARGVRPRHQPRHALELERRPPLELRGRLLLDPPHPAGRLRRGATAAPEPVRAGAPAARAAVGRGPGPARPVATGPEGRPALRLDRRRLRAVPLAPPRRRRRGVDAQHRPPAPRPRTRAAHRVRRRARGPERVVAAGAGAGDRPLVRARGRARPRRAAAGRPCPGTRHRPTRPVGRPRPPTRRELLRHLPRAPDSRRRPHAPPARDARRRAGTPDPGDADTGRRARNGARPPRRAPRPPRPAPDLGRPRRALPVSGRSPAGVGVSGFRPPGSYLVPNRATSRLHPGRAPWGTSDRPLRAPARDGRHHPHRKGEP